MRRKIWLKYFIYILLLCILIFLKEYVTGKLEISFKRTWGAGGSYLLLITVPFIFNLVIGLFFGIDYFFGEIKKAGSWKINLPKTVLIGLPSLFFSLTYHVAYINNPLLHSILLKFAILGTNYIPVFQIVLGYILITCLYRHNGEIDIIE